MERRDGWALLTVYLLCSCKSASFAICKKIIGLFTFVCTMVDECNEKFMQNTQ